MSGLYQVLAGALIVAALWWAHGWDKARATAVARDAGRAEVTALWHEAVQAAERERDRKTLRLIDNAQEADNAMLKERAATNRVIAGLRTERNRLRDEIAAYATGRDLGPEAAAATCSARAAALGGGLERTLRAEEDLVAELESARSDTRRLLEDARAVRAAQ